MIVAFDEEVAALWAGRAGVVLTAAAAVAWIVAWVLSTRVSTPGDARLLKSVQASSTATVEAAEARHEAAAASERAARFEIEASEQRERAAAAEHALLDLQRRLAWRTFTAEQRQTVSRELSQFEGTTLMLTMYGEVEANRFANQVASLLRSANWLVVVQNAPPTSALPPSGVICIHPRDHKAAEAFIRLMKSAGFDVTEGLGATFQVTVGVRPAA